MISFLNEEYQFVVCKKNIDIDKVLNFHDNYLKKRDFVNLIEVNKISAKSKLFKSNKDLKGINKVFLEIRIYENEIIFLYTISINNLYIFFIFLAFLITVFPSFWESHTLMIDSIPSFIFLSVFYTSMLYLIKKHICKKIVKILFYNSLKTTNGGFK